MLPRVQAAASNGERCWDAAPVRPVKPTTNTAVDDRETWITSTFRDGTTVRYWGDPEEWVDWDEFELPAQQEGGDEVVGLWDATSERAPRTGALEPDCEGTGEDKNRPRASKASPAKSTAELRGVPLAVRMADVEAEEVEWLWHPYIPFGKLTSVEGDPGIGKSWLTMALAAQVSRGAKLPGASRAVEPSAVLLLTAEDGPGDTLRPRLDTLGADVSRVHAITEPLAFNKEGAAKLKSEIVRVGALLVIIDPIVAYLPDRTDMNSASAVRPVLARLARVAEETGAAIVFVRHLSKGTKEKAMYRGLGSIDFTAACRSVLMVGADPNDASKRVVAHAKSNLAQMGPSQAYTLKSGRFAWAGRSSLSAEELGGPPPDADLRSAREEATEFLIGMLADGPKPALQVQAEAAKLRISSATLRRAKRDLKVKSEREGEQWTWNPPVSLPAPTSEEAVEDIQASGG